MKLYFSNITSEERCYPLDYIKQKAKEEGVRQIEVREAEREINSDAFYCSKEDEIMGKGFGYCGKECKFYQPRNGKSGICRHNKQVYTPKKEVKIIKL
jgi:hypothetical protein